MWSYSPLIDFKPITFVLQNSDLAKDWLQIYLYTYVGGQARSHLERVRYTYPRYLQTRTDKYDLKVWLSTLRTVTNSFTLRARNNYRLGFSTLVKHFSRQKASWRRLYGDVVQHSVSAIDERTCCRQKNGSKRVDTNLKTRVATSAQQLNPITQYTNTSWLNSNVHDFCNGSLLTHVVQTCEINTIEE